MQEVVPGGRAAIEERSECIDRASWVLHARAQTLEQVQETQEEHVQVLNVFTDALDAVHAHEGLEEWLEEHREGVEDCRVLQHATNLRHVAVQRVETQNALEVNDEHVARTSVGLFAQGIRMRREKLGIFTRGGHDALHFDFAELGRI